MTSIFTKIIEGTLPSYKIAENEKCYAFLDIAPLMEGHTLVIPKIEVDHFFDLPDEYIADLLVFAKPIAHAIEKSFPCNRCAMSVVGLEVPYAHIHLLPINSVEDMNFSKAKQKVTAESLQSTQQKILAHLSL